MRLYSLANDFLARDERSESRDRRPLGRFRLTPRYASALPWHNDAGLSLLELMIVLMLMAIIASVVIPVFGSGVSTTELKRSAREVAAGLRLARSQAIATRSESILELDVAQRAFRVPPDPRVHTMPEGIELKLYTAQRDLVGEQLGAVRFFPDGGSNGGRITLAAGERKYDVDIDWLTGRVSILE